MPTFGVDSPEDFRSIMRQKPGGDPGTRVPGPYVKYDKEQDAVVNQEGEPVDIDAWKADPAVQAALQNLLNEGRGL